MTYPTLQEAAARNLFVKYTSGTSSELDLDAATLQVEGYSFEKEMAAELCNLLWEFAQRGERGKTGWGNRFERRAASIVHECLNLIPRIAGDPGFWLWLTFAADGELAELVDWRYGKEELGSAAEHYYGFDKIKQGMYGYLWLRANAVYDVTLEDPYELTRRGDVDVWQSHIIRVDYGSVPTLSRAFIRFAFPSEDEQSLSRDEYRKLAVELTRRNASMSFELLDDDAALAFVENVWDERRDWMGGGDTG